MENVHLRWTSPLLFRVVTLDIDTFVISPLPSIPLAITSESTEPIKFPKKPIGASFLFYLGIPHYAHIEKTENDKRYITAQEIASLLSSGIIYASLAPWE